MAALVTIGLVVGVAVWFTIGRPDDDAAGTDAVGRAPAPSASTTTVPPTADAATSAAPLPSTLHERVQKREADTEELAAAAGDAGLGADGDRAATPPPPDDVESTGDADLAAAHGWLESALAWREDDADVGAWSRAVERANVEWATDDVQTVIVPRTALEHIAFDASVHGALPRIVSVTDETDHAFDPPDVVTLSAEVVFGTGGGWSRPGLRLLVSFQVVDGKVVGVFIDNGYVASDPELAP